MAVFRVPIELSWPGDGSPGVNIWSVRAGDPLTAEEDLQSGIDAIRAFYLGIAGTFYPALTLINCGEVINRDNDQTVEVDFAQVSSGAGPAPAPPSLQVCISWRTALRARRGMGRTFIGPLAAGVVSTDGTIGDSALTTLNTAISTLVGDSTSGINGWAIGVWGQEDAMPEASPEARRAAPHVHRDIIAWKVKDRFAVLRSRRD